jgi:ribonuclease Z
MAGLLTLAGYLQRVKQRKRLALYGPPGTRRAVEALLSVSPDLEQFFVVEEVGHDECFFSQRGKHVEAAEIEASPDAQSYAYRFFEDPLPGRVDAQLATARGIQGVDFRRLQAGERVRGVRPEDVIGPPRPCRSVVVSGRSRPCTALTTVLEGVDVAVIPAPFLDERLPSAERTFTLTGWEAASVATNADVKLLLLVQLSGTSAPMAQLGEARQFHRNVFVPWDGDRVGVPIPENGRPRVQRWRERRPS